MPGAKEYDFVVTLRHPDYTPFNIISSLLCVMAVVAAVLGLLHMPFTSYSYFAVALIIVIITFLIISIINRKRRDYIITFRWALTASALLWFAPPLGSLGIAVFYIIASLVERQIKFPQEVGFTKDEITINSFPNKHYIWQQIQNIILKDNLLTIDFKNNKILQKQTETDVDATTEKEFNEFCMQQINYIK